MVNVVHKFEIVIIHIFIKSRNSQERRKCWKSKNCIKCNRSSINFPVSKFCINGGVFIPITNISCNDVIGLILIDTIITTGPSVLSPSVGGVVINHRTECATLWCWAFCFGGNCISCIITKRKFSDCILLIAWHICSYDNCSSRCITSVKRTLRTFEYLNL